MTVTLTGTGLTLEDVVRVARSSEPVELVSEAVERMREARAVVEAAVDRGDAVYGVTTGVASRKRVRVSADEAAEFNRRLIQSHRVGQGPAAPTDVVRAAMLRLANGFASGTTGVRPQVAERLVAALNASESPHVRLLGSIGQSDLAPNADLAHGLFEEFPLASGEALWLVNSNAFSTGFAALAVADAERLLDSLHVAGALDLEAFAANLAHLHPVIARTRPSAGLRASLEQLTELLAGSSLWEPGAARNLQDPLSFRGLPQMLGAVRDALDFVLGQLDIELNASSWNPLVVTSEDKIVSASNVDVVALAAALDFFRVVLASALTAANERMMKLLQQTFLRPSGWPGGPARPPRGRTGRAGKRWSGDDRRSSPPRAAGVLRGREHHAGGGHRGPDDHGAASGPAPRRDGGARSTHRRDRARGRGASRRVTAAGDPRDWHRRRTRACARASSIHERRHDASR